MVLIFILAFLLRLIGLNQSLWLDEGTTAKVVLKYGFSDIVTKFSILDFHPPLYYFLIKIWTALFGYSEVSLRLPSILFSLGTGWFVYLIVKKLKDNKTAVWALLLFLFNPLIVYYSQEARMYMMATFFLTAAFYFFQESCHSELDPGSRNKFGMTFYLFNIFSFLSLCTFYGSAFFLGGLYVWMFYKKEWKHLYISVCVTILTLVFLGPLLFKQLINARQALGLVPNWRQVLGGANIKNLALIPVKFSFGRISFYPKKLYLILSSLWTALVFIFVVKGGIKNKTIGFLFLFPLILGVIFSLFTPLLQYFRFLYIVPLMCILIALSVKNNYLKAGLVAGFVVLSFVYVLFPQFYREDWKALALRLPYQPVFMIASSADPLKYYQPSVTIQELRTIQDKKITEKTITVVPYTADIYGFDYKKYLLLQSFVLQKKTTVRSLEYEVWERK